MKTVSQLHEAVAKGARPVVTFRSRIRDHSAYIEAGMRARITSSTRAYNAEGRLAVGLVLNLVEFAGYNSDFETPRHQAAPGTMPMTSQERGLHKPLEVCFLHDHELLDCYFEPVAPDRHKLLSRFMQERETARESHYVSWLESMVLATQNLGAPANVFSMRGAYALEISR